MLMLLRNAENIRAGRQEYLSPSDYIYLPIRLVTARDCDCIRSDSPLASTLVFRDFQIRDVQIVDSIHEAGKC